MKNIPAIDWKRVDLLIDMAIEEDLGETGDITSLSVVPAEVQAKAVLRCKEEGMIMAGQAVAERVFRKLDPACEYTVFKADGEICKYGDIVAEVRGRAQSLLTAERTALNFIQRLCGVATTAGKYAAALGDSSTVVLDTRKTTPGYRNLEKYAVAVGGASNHRIGLFDRIMIKDNHREMAGMEGPGGIIRSVERARAMYPDLEVEVEVDTLEELDEALQSGCEYILLDNMSTEMMAEAVKRNQGRAKLEASGNITIERLPEIAAVGVDYASSGALTHSVKSSDISLDITPLK